MKKLLIACCLLGILIEDTETKNPEHILDTVDCVVDLLWTRVNDGWFVTTGSYMSRFFTRYDPGRKGSLSLWENQFTNGDSNFVKDFATCGMTDRFASAYFRTMNMYDHWLLRRLTIEDLDLFVDAIDHHTGNIGLGFVTASQFKKGLTERVFRSLPLSLLYRERMDDQLFKGNMKLSTFVDIHTDMDSKDRRDGKVTKTEMGRFWKDYDGSSSGKTLFNKLDYQGLKYINVTHWEAVFDDLNCVSSPEDKITHSEFIQLDLIQHGDRPYPLDKQCFRDDLRKQTL